MQVRAGRKKAGGNFTGALWEAVSLAQHHDAITGTAKQHVASDYSQRIAAGAPCQRLTATPERVALFLHPSSHTQSWYFPACMCSRKGDSAHWIALQPQLPLFAATVLLPEAGAVGTPVLGRLCSASFPSDCNQIAISGNDPNLLLRRLVDPKAPASAKGRPGCPLDR